MLKRLTFFAYGLAAYVVFLVTFLYAIAFVGGFGVPTRLDGAAQPSLALALAVDAALLTIFAVQHSVMARRWFKEWWTQIVPWTIERSTFVLFGLRQVWLPLIGKPYTRIEFRTPMPYRYVRHPLYFGFLLGFWMTPTMTLAHLVFAITTTAYI